MPDRNLINEDIRVPQVRLVDENGAQLGVVQTRAALNMALERELDLVMIAPQGVPPVCKLMDYGKFRFESSKREKENRKKQKVVSVKEVKLSYSIDERDLEIKARNAIRMLNDGDKVRVSIQFRGRQITHANLGEKTMLHFADVVAEHGKIDRAPKLEGRSMVMFVSPIVVKEPKGSGRESGRADGTPGEVSSVNNKKKEEPPIAKDENQTGSSEAV